MKYLLTLIILAGLGGGGWYFWKQSQSAKPLVTQPQRPTTAIVEARDISFAVTGAGDIGPADQVSVRPEVNGRIMELPVDIGDKVKKGDLLCRLDDQDLQTERDQQLIEIAGSKLQIHATKLQLTKAERDFQRNKELYDKNLISLEQFQNLSTELDLMRNQIDISKNGLDRTEKAVKLVEDRLTKTKLRAPFDCTVLTRPVSLGQTVSGAAGFNSGTEVMTIANLNDMIVNAHINQADVVRLAPDQPVNIQVESLAGVTMKGSIERLAPQATIKNGIKGFAARIRIVQMDPRVRPGMTATLSIPIAAADNVLAVPLAAVFSEEGDRFVLIKKEEGYERRPVAVGVTDYQFAEIQSGLTNGEVVMLEAPKDLLNQRAKSKEKDGKAGKSGKGSKTVTSGKPATEAATPALINKPAVIPSKG
ncbi:MAG: efflux RND transporter periplasmic adaptor subunit [Verrucomicrobiota bacterium]